MTILAPQTVDKKHHMKKIFTLLCAVALVSGFAACGMSEEERKQDSMQQDSVNKETQDTGDSLIQMMERQNDSMNKADSVAAAQKAADSAAGKK